MGCGEGLVMPVSPAWPVAAKRIQEREMVGEQCRAGNGPPGGKAQRARQSLGRKSGSSEEPVERLLERRPPAHPTPEGAHRPGQVWGRIQSPHLRLVSGRHFLLHLSDSIMPPCNFRLGLLCLPSPHFSLWPVFIFFWQTKYGQQAELTA